MAAAFAQLRPVEQHVMWLIAIEGLVAAEAAARLSIDPAELGQIAFHARDRLRVRYAAEVRAAAARGCRRIADHLGAHALGVAPKDLQAEIRFHLAQCVPCAETLADLGDPAAALRRARLAPPVGLPAAVRSAAVPTEPVLRRSDRRAHTLGAVVLLLGLAGAVTALDATDGPAAEDLAVSDGFLAPTVPPEPAPAFNRPTVVLASTVEPDPESATGGGATTEVLGAVVSAPSTTTTAPPVAAVSAEPAAAPEVPVEPPAPVPDAPSGLVPAVVETVADLVGGVAGLLGGLLGS